MIPKDLVERAHRVGATGNVEDAKRDLSRWSELHARIINDLIQAIEYHELTICPHCGEPWPVTETIRADGSLGCPCQEVA